MPAASAGCAGLDGYVLESAATGFPAAALFHIRFFLARAGLCMILFLFEILALGDGSAAAIHICIITERV